MNFVNSKKSPLSKKFDVAHGVDRAGCRISERIILNKNINYKKFLNFHQNEITFAKRGVAPSERNVTLGLF